MDHFVLMHNRLFRLYCRATILTFVQTMVPTILLVMNKLNRKNILCTNNKIIVNYYLNKTTWINKTS